MTFAMALIDHKIAGISLLPDLFERIGISMPCVFVPVFSGSVSPESLSSLHYFQCVCVCRSQKTKSCPPAQLTEGSVEIVMRIIPNPTISRNCIAQTAVQTWHAGTSTPTAQSHSHLWLFSVCVCCVCVCLQVPKIYALRCDVHASSNHRTL